MVGHRSRRDREEAGFGGALPNQRHRRGGAGARVNGFDAHGVGHLPRVTVPAEVEFGWDAGGFEVGVSCHRVPIPAAGWQRWEAELGAGRLLGSEGFIAAGPREDTVAAMEAAGAAFSWLDLREIAARIPFVAAPWQAGVLDPLGGSLRIRRALAALARRVDIHRAEVASVAGDGSVTLPDGTLVRGDRVLICAGVACGRGPDGPPGRR
jgi:hypothetical protein